MFVRLHVGLEEKALIVKERFFHPSHFLLIIFIAMASSLRRRDVLMQQHLERKRDIENGKVFIKPDTEPVIAPKKSIFTSRHISYNSTSNLLLTEACDKEYRASWQSQSQVKRLMAMRRSKSDFSVDRARRTQNKYMHVRPRTRDLYIDATTRKKKMDRLRKRKPRGLKSKPTIYSGKRPASAPPGQSAHDRLYANTSYLRPKRSWTRDDEDNYLRAYLTKKVRKKNFVPRVASLGLSKYKRPSSTNLKFNDVELKDSKMPEAYFTIKGRAMLPRFMYEKY